MNNVLLQHGPTKCTASTTHQYVAEVEKKQVAYRLIQMTLSIN
jgi:hypothetical protein